MKITLEIKNFAAIKNAFDKFPVKMTQNLNVAVEKIVTKIDRDAKRLAPVNKQGGGGNLRQSIRSGMTGVASGAVVVMARYAYWVHQGTLPHIIRAINKKGLANKRSGQFFGKIVKHPGTKANPFLRGAVIANQAYADKEFSKAVDQALK